MILIDAGPLIATIDTDSPAHAACVATLESIREPAATTWPIITEASHLASRRFRKGSALEAQSRLLNHLTNQTLRLIDLPPSAAGRMIQLMEKYADLPMDLADASLVYAAESTGSSRVLTLDTHFMVYRIDGRRRFKILPALQ